MAGWPNLWAAWDLFGRGLGYGSLASFVMEVGKTRKDQDVSNAGQMPFLLPYARTEQVPSRINIHVQLNSVFPSLWMHVNPPGCIQSSRQRLG